MSRLLARIMLAIFIIPTGTLVYILCFVAGVELTRRSNLYYSSRQIWIFVGSGLTAWLVLAAYWIALWRTSVQWTTVRIRTTVIATILSALLGAVLGALVSGIAVEFAAFLASISAPILWLIATTLVWRETNQERAARLQQSNRDNVVCPTCGYNLTGLNGTRCPECGSQFTLDELFASQAKREEAEIA